jgi:hypothetical protein
MYEHKVEFTIPSIPYSKHITTYGAYEKQIRERAIVAITEHVKYSCNKFIYEKDIVISKIICIGHRRCF